MDRVYFSEYLSALRCRKLFWLDCHANHYIPSNVICRHRNKERKQITKLAEKLFLNGITPSEYIDNNKSFSKYISKRIPLFKPKITAGNTLLEIDILEPCNENDWNIIKICSGSKTTQKALDELAFIKSGIESLGLNINKVFALTLNKEFGKDGYVKAHKIFNKTNITNKIDKIDDSIVQDGIDSVIRLSKTSKCPATKIGLQCLKPKPCKLKDICWRDIPKDNPSTLYRYHRSKSINLINDGITDIRNITEDTVLTSRQQIQKNCLISGNPYINKLNIRRFLGSLKWPQYHLDFESIAPAIPIFERTRSYQAIPVQFSLHIWNSIDAKPIHHDLICDPSNNPFRELLKRLYDLTGNEGSIVVYNKVFETMCLRSCVDQVPEMSEWLNENILPRIVDLLEPFRKFDYYHPSQNGSCSLKVVSKILARSSYDNLECKNGLEATAMLYDIYQCNDPFITHDYMTHLKKYCKLDTLVMIEILQSLYKIISD